MQRPRRQFLQLAAGAALSALPRAGWAQAYPARPVRLVVGTAAGSVQDILSRVIAQWLAEQLGQPFVIDNRVGAGTNIATEAVVRAPADGYTLLSIGPSSAVNATLYPKLGFNFIRDIAPVASMVHQSQVVVVNPSMPVKTMAEFVAYTKANPGKVNFASSGVGTGNQLAVELFKMVAGRRHGARAVSRRRAGDDRSDRRAGGGDVRLAGGGDGAHQERQAAGARGDHRQARRSAAGPAAGGGHGPGLRIRAPGSASAPRTARRPNSSRCSTRPSMPGSPTPRCGRAIPSWAAGSSPARRRNSAS